MFCSLFVFIFFYYFFKKKKKEKTNLASSHIIYLSTELCPNLLAAGIAKTQNLYFLSSLFSFSLSLCHSFPLYVFVVCINFTFWIHLRNAFLIANLNPVENDGGVFTIFTITKKKKRFHFYLHLTRVLNSVLLMRYFDA